MGQGHSADDIPQIRRNQKNWKLKDFQKRLRDLGLEADATCQACPDVHLGGPQRTEGRCKTCDLAKKMRQVIQDLVEFLAREKRI